MLLDPIKSENASSRNGNNFWPRHKRLLALNILWTNCSEIIVEKPTQDQFHCNVKQPLNVFNRSLQLMVELIVEAGRQVLMSIVEFLIRLRIKFINL